MSFNQHHALELVARLADRSSSSSKLACELPRLIEVLTNVECPDRPRNGQTDAWWRKVRKIAVNLVGGELTDEERIVHQNAARLGEHFSLSPLEIRIFLFVALYRIFESFETVVDQALDTREIGLPGLLSLFCETQETEIRKALKLETRLTASGLLQKERRGFQSRFPYVISERLCAALTIEVDDLEDLVGIMFPAAPAPEAEWQDFESLGRDGEFVRTLLGQALASGAKGINVLLYGRPGTGKTEFSKVLAAALNARLRAVGERNGEGFEPSRHDRLMELKLAGRMLGRRRDTLLLFDEMEDVMGDSLPMFDSDKPSKVHSNRLLETNPLPVIWTTNSVDNCDPAFLRRMTFSVEMRTPGGAVRGRIWQRLNDRHQAGIETEGLAMMAAAHEHPPALVSDAMRTARLCGGGTETFSRVLGASAKLANGGIAPLPGGAGAMNWQPQLAQADIDLVMIEARLSRVDAPRQVSFCLEGPPGTGKSAWARHLAGVIGLPVHEKRASDLKSPYVGESERNIARAFEEARQAGALLIFDEAETFLADRRGAHHAWEVSLTNEMLTWMERHPLPFVCTTNFAERLDPATQRRFTFHVRFGWLSSDQLEHAWKTHFDGDAPAGLARLERLTPGDFANVARRSGVLGEKSPARILEELNREAEMKHGPLRSIGFTN